MEEFPSNSQTAQNRQREIASEEDKTEEPTPINKKLITGKVKERPKTLKGKLKDVFVADGANFSGQLYENIVKPKVQELAMTILATVLDGVKDSASQIITGRPARPYAGSSAGPARPSTPYHRIRPGVPVRDAERFTDRVVTINRSNRVRELIVEDPESGSQIIAELKSMIQGLGHVTVGDYYDLMGEPTVATDHEWGWTNLDNARPRFYSGDGWVMKMPVPRPIAG